MWMAPNEFLARPRQHRCDLNAALLLGDIRSEQYLHHQVTELVLDFPVATVLDRVGCFVSFLDQMARGGRERLFAVPRALLAQLADHFEQREKFLGRPAGRCITHDWNSRAYGVITGWMTFSIRKADRSFSASTVISWPQSYSR